MEKFKKESEHQKMWANTHTPVTRWEFDALFKGLTSVVVLG